MKKTSVYIISITAALALLLCACARTGNVVNDAKDDVVDTTDKVVDDVTDTTRDVVDDMTGTTGSDGIVRDNDGIIDDDDTGRMNNNAGDGMPDNTPGMTETDGINAGRNSLDTDTNNSIGASTATDVPAAR